MADTYYGDERKLGAAFAETINREIQALAEADCRWIQIDEPVFAREPEKALAFGIENLERCFHGVPEHVVRTVHMCCGYPDRLDNENHPKADPSAYCELADPLDASSIETVSVGNHEEAYNQQHRHVLADDRATHGGEKGRHATSQFAKTPERRARPHAAGVPMEA